MGFDYLTNLFEYCSDWTWPVLIGQSLTAVISLWFLTFYIFDLGLGGFVEPFIEGLLIDCALLARLVYFLRVVARDRQIIQSTTSSP